MASHSATHPWQCAMLRCNFLAMTKNRVLRTKRQYERQRSMNIAFAKEGENPLILVLDHLKPDYNVGKLFRTAEAMQIQSICVVGMDWFDVSPAKGCFKHLKARFFEDWPSCYEFLKASGHEIFCLDVRGTKQLHEVEFPKKSALILGHEENGPSFDPMEYDDVTGLRIQQFGRVESLNVSVAGALGIYEYMRQNSFTALS